MRLILKMKKSIIEFDDVNDGDDDDDDDDEDNN